LKSTYKKHVPLGEGNISVQMYNSWTKMGTGAAC